MSWTKSGSDSTVPFGCDHGVSTYHILWNKKRQNDDGSTVFGTHFKSNTSWGHGILQFSRLRSQHFAILGRRHARTWDGTTEWRRSCRRVSFHTFCVSRKIKGKMSCDFCETSYVYVPVGAGVGDIQNVAAGLSAPDCWESGCGFNMFVIVYLF